MAIKADENLVEWNAIMNLMEAYNMLAVCLTFAERQGRFTSFDKSIALVVVPSSTKTKTALT